MLGNLCKVSGQLARMNLYKLLEPFNELVARWDLLGTLHIDARPRLNLQRSLSMSLSLRVAPPVSMA